jgi:hypothetical protein
MCAYTKLIQLSGIWTGSLTGSLTGTLTRRIPGRCSVPAHASVCAAPGPRPKSGGPKRPPGNAGAARCRCIPSGVPSRVWPYRAVGSEIVWHRPTSWQFFCSRSRQSGSGSASWLAERLRPLPLPRSHGALVPRPSRVFRPGSAAPRGMEPHRGGPARDQRG